MSDSGWTEPTIHYPGQCQITGCCHCDRCQIGPLVVVVYNRFNRKLCRACAADLGSDLMESEG